MALSKKIRFEVFKRDGFKCQYCGKNPPEVTLEIDHINPKSKGGRDDINNLITACFDCNRGKSNIPLEKIPNSLNDNLEILKEKENQLKEYNSQLLKIEKRINKSIKEISEIYELYFPKYCLSEKFKNSSLKHFINKLPLQIIINSMHQSCYKMQDNNEGSITAIKYFCGICWNKIRENHNG